MSQDLANLVLELFTIPLTALGFEIAGDPMGTSAFIAERLGHATEYQLKAAANEIAMGTERTRAGRLLFPEPKRAVDSIRSQPPADPRAMRSVAPAPGLHRSSEPPFVTAARKFVAHCDADAAIRKGCDRVNPGRYEICLDIIDKADRGLFTSAGPAGAPVSDEERGAVLDRVLGGLRIGGVGLRYGGGA